MRVRGTPPQNRAHITSLPTGAESQWRCRFGFLLDYTTSSHPGRSATVTRAARRLLAAYTPTRLLPGEAMTAAILHVDLDALPPLSPLAGQLLRLDMDQDDAPEQLEAIVRSEPQLSARIVGLANSVAFTPAGAPFLSSLHQCLQRIGLQRAAMLSAASLFGHAISHRLPRKSAMALWLHALTTAQAAQELARHLGREDANDAYLLGLCHDLGYMLIEFSHAGALDRLAEATLAGGTSQEEAERELFGADHAELTRRLLEHWELPEALTEPIRIHHRDPLDPRSPAALLRGAESLACSSTVVDLLYADLGHPFVPIAGNLLALEDSLGSRFAITADGIKRLLGRIVAAVSGLQQSARAMASGH